MARRRTLHPLDPDELDRVARNMPRKASGPPMAQIAADVSNETIRVRNEVDAEQWRAASAGGRVIREIPLGDIVLDHVTRDRMQTDEEALDELAKSIRSSGLRLPIEVTILPDGRYGLISGFRRVQAIRQIHQAGDGPDWIKAIVVERDTAASAYVSMVEENEVRTNLTPYERGRVAVIATKDGAFDSVEAAVDAIYASASKAKRSKIRSFAAIHEAIGDVLKHPQALTERGGLRIAQALRDGAEPGLRQALLSEADDSQTEWKHIEAALARVDATSSVTKSRGGRPRRSIPDDSKIMITHERTETGQAILIDGQHIENALMDDLVRIIKRRLTSN